MPPSPIQPPTLTPLDWARLGLLSVLWGGSFFFVEIAVESVPTFTLVALRVGLAAVILIGVLLILKHSLKPLVSHAFAFLGMGLLNNVVPFSLIAWGQTSIASGLASILNATTPLFTVIVAHLLTSDERLTPRRTIGVLVGFAGVVIMTGWDVLEGLGESLPGQLAILGAALSYGFAGVFGRRFRRLGIAPMTTATGQVTASTLILGPVALVIDTPLSGLLAIDRGVWGAIAGLAIVSTALAYILFFQILASAGAVNIMLVTLLVPVSATALGISFLGESLTLTQAAGMACIASGLLLIDPRLIQLGRRLRPSPNKS